MTVATRLFCPAILAITLAVPTLAEAAPQDSLLAAYTAYKAENISQLTQIANAMPADPLQRYPSYWLTLKALKKNDDDQVSRFLSQGDPSLLNERIRREWLKNLGKQQNWRQFESEWNKLPVEGRDEETQCYADLLALRQGHAPDNLDRFLESRALPEGCDTLINAAATRGLITQDWLWQRLRLLLAGNFTTLARQFAAANNLAYNAKLLNSPARADLSTRQGQEVMLFAIEMKAKTDLSAAMQDLQTVENALGKSAAGFAWGQLALFAARKQQASDALQWFAKADQAQFSKDQWEWWVRSALRLGQWDTVQNIIQTMPGALANKSVWQYWLARALRAQNHSDAANPLFAKVSQDRGYYGLLALDELGTTLSTMPDRIVPSDQDVTTMKTDPAVIRALELFDISVSAKKPDLYSNAQAEWRWAMRGRTDMQLLAASEIARKASFYDMAIYSAERTQTQHDFNLRYLMPYRDITQRYAKQLNIDDAWVYGLIRQESRFIKLARSGAGASGLMQLMPNTARWVAKKIGLSNDAQVHDIDTNIQLGTWYLKYVLTTFGGNEVLATASYNAGPGRARRWQGSVPIDGTVYAETIPFSETRNYVQKVMANAAYYNTALGGNKMTLKTRMGTIPARGSIQITETAP